LPVVYFLFQSSFRGSRDSTTLAKVIVAAACVKAVVAIYVRSTVAPPPGQTLLEYATTHADSMLFSVAICLVVAPLFEQYSRKRVLIALAVVPLVVAGIVANTRRLAWVEVGIGLLALFFASGWTRLKRRVTRTVLLMSPIILIYAAAGWNSQAGVFRPVQIIQSVVDSKADPSTEWRDWENYDLFYTLRQSPILGTGYGHGFIEHVKLRDVSRVYALERFIPHNSILGLWAYGGLIGFGALWGMLVVGVYLGARAHRFAETPEERTASVAVPAVLAIYMAHCYGDMGLGTWTSIFIVAPTLAIAAKLAVSTGAWPTKKAKRVAAKEPARVAFVVQNPRGLDVRLLGGPTS
jgi:O-antigen ligase